MWCYVEDLGSMRDALTKWGYVGGKINFIICTYLMCIETINLTADHEQQRKETMRRIQSHFAGGEGDEESSTREEDASSDTDSDPGYGPHGRREAHAADRFYLNPFRARKALRNLERLGAGPWPYYASLIYLLGVVAFTVGLVAEFMTFLPEQITEWTLLISFELGSLMFLGGGVMECVENDVFTYAWKGTQGWWGAIFNTLGGLGFTVGATLGFFHGLDYEANFAYGVGSLIFALGSGVMIVMWKDEQFGLTFLAVLNDGPPSILTNQKELEKAATFTPAGTVFIMMYCLAASLSFYHVTIALTAMTFREDVGQAIAFSNAFNAFMPCIFAHLMLALNSAVIKSPRHAPFRQLYFFARFMSVCMVVNSLCRIVEAIYLANEHVQRYGHHVRGPDCHLATLS